MSDKIKKILAYLIPFLGGVAVFFLTQKEEKEVKFHAVQGLLFWVIVAILGAVLGVVIGWIPFVGWIIGNIFELIVFVVLVLIIYRLVKEQEVKLLILYGLTERILKNV